MKAALYCSVYHAHTALVATNSICQGEQVPLLWPLVMSMGVNISFAYTSFKWSNLATDQAGVTVVIVGLSRGPSRERILITENSSRVVDYIGPYLVPNSSIVVEKRTAPWQGLAVMYLGNMAKDGGYLFMTKDEARKMVAEENVPRTMLREFFGSEEVIHAKPRVCLWLTDKDFKEAMQIPAVKKRLDSVRDFRSESPASSTRAQAKNPHRFIQLSAGSGSRAIVIPRVSSESRPYLPVDYKQAGPVIGDKCFALYDAPLWNMALIASRLHWVWIGTVCVRLEMRFSYSNTLGWNTFPLPTLTEQNKADLTRCAEEILLARERHFPKTIADLYDPENMPEDLRRAHELNDETLERIYIGRRFKNDTERLEKLFELYAKMVTAKPQTPQKKSRQKGAEQLEAFADA